MDNESLDSNSLREGVMANDDWPDGEPHSSGVDHLSEIQRPSTSMFKDVRNVIVKQSLLKLFFLLSFSEFFLHSVEVDIVILAFSSCLSLCFP